MKPRDQTVGSVQRTDTGFHSPGSSVHKSGRSVLARIKRDLSFHARYEARGGGGPYLVAPRPMVRRPQAFDARTRLIKRIIDIVIASTALAILAPVLIIVAIVIAFDSRGPVLFRQIRVGKDGQQFVMHKFRTMQPDRRTRTSGAPANVPERRRVHKSPSDPRITGAGRFLRRCCLDEIPQLWNVLRGDMSLIGPRPELPEIVAKYEPWQHRRHVVPPGVTGWWQVNRDGVRLMHEATDLDMYYIEHWSARLDLLILTRTLRVVMRGVGAF